MSFVKDLAEGREFEHRVIEILSTTYPLDKWESNTEKKGIDIISKWGKAVEVKYDKKAHLTWNLFIEIQCGDKQSWLYAYDKMDCYAYGTVNKLYLFNIGILKEAIATTNFRKVKWGDGWRVHWVLIPIKDAEQLASNIINLCK